MIPLELQKEIPQLKYLIPNEIYALKTCNNPNILGYIDDYSSKTNVYIITEFCDSGNLSEML